MKSEGAISFLQTSNNGKVGKELDKEFRQLVAKCRDLFQKGTLTVTLTVVPHGASELTIKSDIKVKAPLKKLPDGTLFATPEGILTRDDPDQMDMEYGANVSPIKPTNIN